jgi:hypothetical protein
MTDLQRLLAIRRHNRSKSQGFDFQSKIVRDGNNKFRVIDGLPHIVYEHWFVAADGTPVHSICTRNYDEEVDPNVEHEPKYCRICDVVKDAWDIWNSAEDYDDEDVYEAGVVIGKNKDKKKGFESSWGAKQFAYFNVVDRDDDWCSKNDHCKVLSKSEKQSGISAGDKGILDELIDMAEEYGDLEKVRNSTLSIVATRIKNTMSPRKKRLTANMISRNC